MSYIKTEFISRLHDMNIEIFSDDILLNVLNKHSEADILNFLSEIEIGFPDINLGAYLCQYHEHENFLKDISDLRLLGLRWKDIDRLTQDELLKKGRLSEDDSSLFEIGTYLLIRLDRDYAYSDDVLQDIIISDDSILYSSHDL